MGKRNLAIVGTHEDYFAEIFDQNTGRDPSRVEQCASAHDAATSYFSNILQNSNARVRTAAIAVWPVAAGRGQQRVFDAEAVLTPCAEPDAEPGEVDVLLNVRER